MWTNALRWIRSLASHPSPTLRRLLARPRLEALEDRVVPATFTVTNTADTGAGSLRQALLDANGAANVSGPDEIHFNIPGAGVQTISPASALPDITDPVVIDGYTQPGASANTLAQGNNAVLRIALSRPNGGPNNGLTLAAGNSTVRGLVINFFSAGIRIQTAGNNHIEGNFLGTDPGGTLDRGNFNGVLVVGTAGDVIGGAAPAARNLLSANDNGVRLEGATGTIIQGNYIGTRANGTAALANDNAGIVVIGGGNLQIGGAVAGAGNLISGNSSQGMIFFASSDNTIQGNFIGTNATGTAALGNGSEGINITDGFGQGPARNYQIGGTTAAARNIISGNGQGTFDPGISINSISASVENIVLEGNFIGTGANGTQALGNASSGILIFESTPSGTVANVRIGGAAAGAGNIIRFNASPGDLASRDDGITISGPAQVAILGNSISDNSDLGIDLESNGVTANDAGDADTGANSLQNFPVLTGAFSDGTTTVMTGSLNSTPNTTFRLEFFSNVAPDPSGNGEGLTFLGAGNVTTDATGNVTFSVAVGAGVVLGQEVAATATDPGGNTSEFSGVISGAPDSFSFDFGDAGTPANDTYHTTLANNGARHIRNGLFLGARSDSESDAQFLGPAQGDDFNGNPNDEDGVVFPAAVVAGTQAAVTVTASRAGRLDAFVDFNGDGDFADAGEKIFDNLAVTAGANNLTFAVPATAPSFTFTRFRLSSAGNLSFDGPAADGEVEDHRLAIDRLDFGDAPDSYHTTLAAGGPTHTIVTGFFLGSAPPDQELDGQPSTVANGDDTNGSDDEDGVTFTTPLAPGQQATVEVLASVSSGGFLDAFLDFNRDGDFADAGEKIFDRVAVSNGTNVLNFSVPAGASLGLTFSRFRLSFVGGLSFVGADGPGEVEDHQVAITPAGATLDFGDAPDSYGTMLASNGPHHTLLPGLYLGDTPPDAELDGQPSAGADGDDSSGTDDEDGVRFLPPLLVGQLGLVEVQIHAPGSAFLNGYLDFNRDGDFTDPGEDIAENVSVVTGLKTLFFNVPADASPGPTYARFRLSLTEIEGAVEDGGAGEVEDFRVVMGNPVESSVPPPSSSAAAPASAAQPPAVVVGVAGGLTSEGLVVPGTAGQRVRVEFRLLSGQADFRNELGLFVVDAAGRAHALALGRLGLFRMGLRRGMFVLFRRGQRPGARRVITLHAGDQMFFFLVQNGTTRELLSRSPAAHRPLTFFSMPGANRDRLRHLLGRRLGRGSFLLSWEDLINNGDHDFNDNRVRVRFLVGP